MLRTAGYIQSYDGEVLTVVAPFTDTYHLTKQDITECEIWLPDGRTISPDQRKKIYATMGEIAEWSGHVPDEIKALAKYDFIARTGAPYFSLSNVDMTTANEFLEYLIEFCVENGIPCRDNLIDRAPDIVRYLYACVVNRKCAICGGKADIHEYDRVGAGRDRREIGHLGQRVQPLCRKHHSECHTIGQITFDNKHHITWVTLDEYACDVLKWRKKRV